MVAFNLFKGWAGSFVNICQLNYTTYFVNYCCKLSAYKKTASHFIETVFINLQNIKFILLNVMNQSIQMKTVRVKDPVNISFTGSL